MGFFNGKAENIEDNRNKVQDLTEAVHGEKGNVLYPSANAVWFLYQPLSEALFNLDEKMEANLKRIDYAVKMAQNASNAVSGAYEGIEKIETDLTNHILPSVDMANEAIPRLFEQKLDVAEANQNFANAIKGNEKGYAVALRDVSPIEHNVAVKVERENILPYPFLETTKTTAGVTFTDLGDGGVRVQGTATSYAMFYLYKTNPFEIGKIYTLSLNPDIATDARILVRYLDSTGNAYYIQTVKKYSFEWKEEYNFQEIYLQVNKGDAVDVTVYPMIYEGTETKSYKPYVPNLSQLALAQQGKNLLPPVKRKEAGSTNIYFFPADGYIILPAGTYTFSVNPKDGEVSNLYIAEADNKFETLKFYRTFSATFTLTETSKIQPFVWKDSYTSTDAILWAQIEAGSKATEYEEYIEPKTYTPKDDGTVEGVTSISPNMTFYVDSGEGSLVDVEYNIDTKKYIDKKFAELQALVLEV